MFYYAVNTVTQAVEKIEKPWEFQPTEKITKQIRFVKEDRQMWYSNEDTRHCFYSGVEGINSNMRVSKENPPHAVHAIIADYDTEIPDSRLDEVIPSWKLKPTWIETSLGGNRRLVWVLARPLPVDSADFYRFMMDRAIKWLTLEKLPGLDTGAFTTATRLFANGCVWRATGHAPISAREMQAFYVECGLKFDYKSADAGAEIPLTEIERALKAKYPNFNWPSEFEKNSQGPSFWIPESTSPLSATVRDAGFFTYSAHATKPFYSWADLLGKEFASDYTNNALAKATEGVYTDSQEYFYKNKGRFRPVKKDVLLNHWQVSCGLSNKPGPDGVSMVQKALEFVNQHNCVDGIAPHVFYPPGIIILDGGKTHLNTYSTKPIEPATTGNNKWGPHGDFPFLSAFADHLMVPREYQLDHFIANSSYFYNSVLAQAPMPGQIIILTGATGIGKTFWNRHVAAYSVGGFSDASRFLIRNETFTSYLFEHGYWVCDDDSPGSNEDARNHVAMMLKKMAANQEHTYHKKYGLNTEVPFSGRLGITTNLDFISTQIISLTDGSKDKINLYRCNPVPNSFPFPTRTEQMKLRNAEIRHFLRYLADYKVPDHLTADKRFGFTSYQEPSLLVHVAQSSESAPFREILISALENFFTTIEPEAKEWRGTVSQCIGLINSDPARQLDRMANMRANFVNASLDRIHKEKLMDCSIENGKLNVRLWVFKRPSDLKSPEKPSAELPKTSYNPFVKV